MTRLDRFLRNLWERLRGRYYEGPDPPPRLAQEVRLFAARDPTPEQWREFSARFAENAYRDGFARGLEWSERLWPGPSVDPDELARELAAYNWALPEEHVLAAERAAAAPSPLAGMTALQAAELQHKLAHAGARIVPLPATRRRPRRA